MKSCYRLPLYSPSALRGLLSKCDATTTTTARSRPSLVPLSWRARGTVINRNCNCNRIRNIHSTSLRLAVAHPPNVHGPPPDLPASEAQVRQRRQQQTAEKVARDHEEQQQEQQEEAETEAELSDAKKGSTTSVNEGENGGAGSGSSPLRRRFWKDVHVRPVSDGYQILLDTRPVRNMDKTVLVIPPSKPFLAHAVALEWDALMSAKQALKQHFIPLTSLTARAGDIARADSAAASPSSTPSPRHEITQMVMRYLDTDTLLSWAPETNVYEDTAVKNNTNANGSYETKETTLRDVQVQTAQPIVSYLVDRVWPGVELRPAFEGNNIIPTPQPEQTQHVIRGWVMNLPPFELAGLERAVLASKSLLIAARLVVEWGEQLAHLRHDDQHAGQLGFGIEEAAEASTLEVTWQTRKWGEVEDTHDVDREDIRRQLGSVVLLVSAQQQQQ